MKIALITDAWFPQVNGVVRTLSTVREELTELGHSVLVISPEAFKTFPCPTYPEIRLAWFPKGKIRRMLDEFGPDAVHIATEGPLGWAGRSVCRKRKWPFTTAFHTKFPEYVHARFRIPVSWGYWLMRKFHRPSKGVMVATKSLQETLESRGFENVKPWTRGVNTELFRPADPANGGKMYFGNHARPVYLFTGRVAVEKNIEAFLKLDLDGTKVVIGDGPMMDTLKARYPEAVFTGYKTGQDLAEHIASGDVFVFPSLTDTFGLVMLEAMACGLPVAAYPVTGPIDVILDDAVGCLDKDLEKAARTAATKDPSACRAYAEGYSWRACAELFFENLHPFAKGA